ncbi:hypothetical protein ABZ960_40535, partial [Streptomyces pseudovenezuelae]|uniref:hypothetical protein n=1 Tax=Streptomyces pseudovenezuelae TaxID=67350 RepID=UPI0034A1B0D4
MQNLYLSYQYPELISVEVYCRLVLRVAMLHIFITLHFKQLLRLSKAQLSLGTPNHKNQKVAVDKYSVAGVVAPFVGTPVVEESLHERRIGWRLTKP